MSYKIATRKSNLALAQTDYVIGEIKKKFGIACEKLLIETTGDKRLDVTLDKIGGKGVFVKDIEIAMLRGEAQAAVHSMKDVPFELENSFEIGAMPIREDVRDALISADGRSFGELPYGAKLGTSSHRRIAQIKALRPDIQLVPIRGNVETRIEKMYKQNLDGIILAYAGLKRLGLECKASSCFSIEEMIPAVGQGALGVEIVKGNEIAPIVKGIDNHEVRVCVEAERSFMKALNGGCHTTIGAYAALEGDRIYMLGIFEVNGRLIKKDIEGSVLEHLDLGRRLAYKIISA
ncbi:hydroxymethylbilane synthase [Clostridium thermarum]|uniref:hydroxymethylbilane synthase n=1 Tax=Clostridium thermarum TaxID=1716543 RepID=UPI0013D40539|nr:hydroxymethylbilane synthase [Clostridium thermarum]